MPDTIWRSPNATFAALPDPGDDFDGVKIGIAYRGQRSADWLESEQRAGEPTLPAGQSADGRRQSPSARRK